MRARVISLLIALLCVIAFPAEALARGGGGRRGGDVYVRGYTRKDGTYVAPHMRSAPDGNFWNNWSTAGNVNPYTGALGTKTPPPPAYLPARSESAPPTYVPGVLYRTDDAIRAEIALRNEQGEFPCYLKVGKSGRPFFYYGGGGYWTSSMGGSWPRAAAPLEIAPWELHERLFAKLVEVSWATAADLALDEGRPGTALRLVEAHASEFTPAELASIRGDVTAFWQVRVDAIRGQWTYGQKEAAYRAATELAVDCAGTSLYERSVSWADTMWTARHPSAGTVREAGPTPTERDREDTSPGDRTTAGSMVRLSRMTYFDWVEVKSDPTPATTPAPFDSTAGNGSMLNSEGLVRHFLGMDKAAIRGDARPVLVYFHWPHEDPVTGRRCASLCTEVLDDEACARWGRMFRCIQVDMSSVDLRVARGLGAGDDPVFAVYAPSGISPVLLIAAQPTPGMMATALAGAISAIPTAKAALVTAAREQGRILAAGRALANEGRLTEALVAYDRIRRGELRVTSNFDAAVIEAVTIEQRLAKAAR